MTNLDRKFIIMQKVMYHLEPVFDQYSQDEVINTIHDYYHNKHKDRAYKMVGADSSTSNQSWWSEITNRLGIRNG